MNLYSHTRVCVCDFIPPYTLKYLRESLRAHWWFHANSLFWLSPVPPYLFMLMNSSLSAKVKYDRGPINAQQRHWHFQWKQAVSEVKCSDSLLEGTYLDWGRIVTAGISIDTVTRASSPFSNVLSHMEVRKIHG